MPAATVQLCTAATHAHTQECMSLQSFSRGSQSSLHPRKKKNAFCFVDKIRLDSSENPRRVNYRIMPQADCNSLKIYDDHGLQSRDIKSLPASACLGNDASSSVFVPARRIVMKCFFCFRFFSFLTCCEAG